MSNRSPSLGLDTKRAFSCRDGSELVLRDVPSCGKAKSRCIVECKEVAGVLREERGAGGCSEMSLGVFKSAVAVEPEAVCPAGESSRGSVPGDAIGSDVKGVPEACEGEAVRGFDEPVGKLVELGGVGEEERVVGGEVREVGVGGGVAEALEVLLGFVPELAHVCLLSWSDCSPVGGRGICVFAGFVCWGFVLWVSVFVAGVVSGEPGDNGVAMPVAIAGDGWGADVEGWAEDTVDGPVA